MEGIAETGELAGLEFGVFEGNQDVSGNEYSSKPIKEGLRNGETAESVMDSDFVMEELSDPKWEEFQLKLRLACLLYSSSKVISKPPVRVDIDKELKSVGLIKEREMSASQGESMLLELVLKSKLEEWLLDRGTDEKNCDPEAAGQELIQLCTLLGYTWAVQLCSRAGLSVDSQDSSGWTALHWAAFCGRYEMVAVLLSEGADPCLVTDSTSDSELFRGDCMAYEIASSMGYNGLAAFLAEKAIVTQLMLLSLSTHVSITLESTQSTLGSMADLTEKDMCEEAQQGYDMVVGASLKIHNILLDVGGSRTDSGSPPGSTDSGFLTVEEIDYLWETSDDIQYIIDANRTVSAIRIQHAFREYLIRKKLKAASRIPHQPPIFELRKDSGNNCLQIIKLQANAPGHADDDQREERLRKAVGVMKAMLDSSEARKEYCLMKRLFSEYQT